jgi:predicted PP-loop superfamily ATPase
MFVINSVRAMTDTLVTTVTYTLTDGTRIVVDVPVFRPQSKDEIMEALKNREITEQSQYDAAPLIQEIKDEMDKEAVGETFVKDAEGVLSVKVN